MIIRVPPPGCFFPLSSLLAFIILLVNTGFAVFMCIDVHMCFFVDMFLEVFFFPRIFLVAKLDQDTQNTQHVYTAHDEDLQTYDQVSLKKNNNAYTYIYIYKYIHIYIYIFDAPAIAVLYPTRFHVNATSYDFLRKKRCGATLKGFHNNQA